MATSTSDVFVWAWLPGAVDPVPAGVLRERGAAGLSFRYADRFLDREGAAGLLYAPDSDNVPRAGVWYEPTQNLGMPAAMRDVSPDSWGRRVILDRLLGAGAEGDTDLLGEAEYALHSGSNRLGNLDFQRSRDEYVPRVESAALSDLYDAADLLEAGAALPPALGAALLAGTAIGGARPKALLTESGRDLIAKFSTSDDVFDVVGAEAAAMALARRAGIPVTPSRVVRSLGRKALVMERFDRPADGTRRGVVSALTMLAAPVTFLPYGSYLEVLDQLVEHATHPAGLREQMFRRVAFNIAIGNTDDHLRNHAAFWDGTHLDLTPAYDLSPALRPGEEAAQAIPYGRDGERRSNLSLLAARAADYSLSGRAAREIVAEVESAVRDGWEDAADEAELDARNRDLLWGRAFLNPGALHDLAS